MLTDAKKAEPAVTCSGLKPVELLRQINSNFDKLWRLAERQLTHGNCNLRHEEGFGKTLI